MAMACSPATPAPMTKTRAAGTVPAAVIIIGKGPAVLGGGIDDGAVAGEVGLGGEHVHHLGAGDARHQLHREGGLRLGQRLRAASWP